MSNSSLVAFTRISPNKTSPRNHAIDTITIHCVVGQVTVERLGEIFAQSSRQASSNYGIGLDGKIGMYVEEKDRSWCSSNAANDNRAITIECASDTKAPYAINDKVYAALTDLCTDICKRNGIKKLVWSTDKNTRVNHLNGCNMTVHRDYAAKSCPGDYIYNRLGQIADEVNARLGSSSKPSGSEISAKENLAVDGSFGPACTRRSQQWAGTEVDGMISYQPSSNRKYLYSAYTGCWQFLASGYDAGSSFIRALQTVLKNKGYYTGAVDGWCGKQTVTAWQKWLQAEGYYTGAIDGSMGPDTVKAWQRYLNEH